MSHPEALVRKIAEALVANYPTDVPDEDVELYYSDARAVLDLFEIREEPIALVETVTALGETPEFYVEPHRFILTIHIDEETTP